MKISYRREMKYNYLIIDPEELIWRNYECGMLAGNVIDGVLHFQLRQVDDEVRFYYEITSRQPLSRMLEGHLIKEHEIRQLILGISRILDRMEQYLLRENCVLLEPDYIYVEPETFRVWLCLVPGLDQDFPESYGKLLEYLLGKVDHQDKNSVILAYGLYQETRKENYGMEDILRLMMDGRKRAEEACEAETEAVSGTAEMAGRRGIERAEQGTAENVHLVRKWHADKKEAKPYESRNEKERKKEHENNRSFWYRIRKRWTDWKKRRKQPTYGQENVSWEQLFRDDLSPDPGVSDPSKEYAQFRGLPANRSQQPEFERGKMHVEEGRNTTLLADLSAETDSGVKKFSAMNSGMEDIVLNYYPFIIGKQEHLVDYCLDHETVSRLHVRVDQSENGWTIQDLNSTNGTMVAGKLLNNNESVPLNPGDEVRIAQLRYRFE